ncbi:MAG: invasion associated locus B family protein [Paracoccaceae bacterium]
MSRLLSTLSAIALIALAAPLAAQDEAQPAQDGADLPGSALSLGEEESDDPQIGDTYVVEEIDDWELQCIRTEQEEDPCTMYQLLTDEEDNPVAEVSIFRLPEGGQAVGGATIIVPLETLLTEQLRLSVDGGSGKRYPFSFCNQVGCYSRIGLTQEDVDAFRRGATATVRIVPFAAPDQTVSLDMSLAGFTAAFEKVSVIDN